MKIILTYCLILLSFLSFGQKDSLLAIFNDVNQTDSLRIKSIGDVAWSYCNTFPDSAIYFAQMELNLAKKKNSKYGMSDALNILGIAHQNRGDILGAVKYQLEALKIREELNDKKGMAATLNNLGNVYVEQEDYDEAIRYFEKSLLIIEELGEKSFLGTVLNNFGLLYFHLEDNDKALSYYQKSLIVRIDLQDSWGIAHTQNNIGKIYLERDQDQNALDLFSNSLKIGRDLKALDIISQSLTSLAIVKQKQNKHKEAIKLGEEALSIANEMGDVFHIRIAAQVLYESYSALNQFQKALISHELFVSLKDSIRNEENQKEVLRLNYQAQYQRKTAADSVKTAEDKKVTDAQIAAQKSELEREQTQRYALYGGLTLLLLFGGFMYNRFRVTHRQKIIIQSQKEEVEIQKSLVDEKNEEILASIAYAKRIQDAILPPIKLVEKYLSDCFILYKPKDIVAGDFYWLENDGDEIYFAAADCTGHGVPGAMVSVVCSNALKRAVKEMKITEPAKILDKVRELVVETFEKSEHDVKDGMDISFCRLNTKTKKLVYSGAHNPLYIVTPLKGDIPDKTIKNDTHMLLEYKGDKQPIGKYSNSKPFVQHEIQLKTGDYIYLSSDGYPDQFGGPRGRKFMYKPFKQLFLSLHNTPISDQLEELNETFEKWRGQTAQIDDICVIGVRIN